MFCKRILNALYYSFSVLFVFVVVAFSIFYYYGNNLPSELTLLDYTPLSTSRIYDSDGELMDEYAIEHRIVLPFEEIPMLVKGAFLIAEDKDFYKHGGISFQGFVRAVIENTARKIWNKKPTGGSTITQQIAKNLLVGTARNLSRKIREAIMAFRIESSLTKDKILEIYLNQLFLGRGCYGVAAACEFYFRKHIFEATPAEIALLASLPSIPNVYINHLDSKKLQIKKNSILYQLYDLGYINKKQLDEAINTSLTINKRKNTYSYPYYADEVFRLVSQKVSKEAFFKCGFTITTTLNSIVQYIATKALEDGLISYTKRQQWEATNFQNIDLSLLQKELPRTINRIVVCKVLAVNAKIIIANDKDNKEIIIERSNKFYTNANIQKGDVILARKIDNNYELYMQPKVTGGIVVMDGNSGDILAMSGGYSFDISAFNCITQSHRQLGSTIKPFVYAVALESGMSEYDVVPDTPINIKISSSEIYSPKNWDNKYSDEINLRDALILSKNVATVRLAQIIGMHKLNNFFTALDLTNKRFPVSAVLGAIDVSPMSLLSAFSIFTNKGKMVKPRFIKHISQFNKQYADESLTAELTKTHFVQVISPDTASRMHDILHDVVRYGTASQLAQLEEKFGIEIIGKTGSTNDWKDAWFVGAITKNSRTLLVCVFVGYPKPKSLGNKAYSSIVAMPIFKSFVLNLFGSTLVS